MARGSEKLTSKSRIAILYAGIALILVIVHTGTTPIIALSSEQLPRPAGYGERVSIGGWIYVPAVSDHRGALVNLSITLSWPGKGVINVSSEGEVSGSTAYSISAAIWTSAILLGVNPLTFNANVTIHAGGTVSGPSASLATATLTMALLSSSYIPTRFKHFVITGAIVPQGFAGPIGGVNEKCEASMKSNLTFILPVANEVELSPSCRASNTSEHRIFTVGTIFESYSLITSLRLLEGIKAPNTTYPRVMQRILAQSAESMIRKSNLTLIKINKIISNKKNYINISNIINSIESNIRLSKSLINKYPYSAASLAFTALAQSLGLYYALLLNEGKLNDEKLIKSIKDNLTKMKEYITKAEKNIRCLEKLEILSVAAARISDSLWNLETYRELRKEGASILDLGYTLGLAEARIYSVKSWIEIFKRIPCLTPIRSGLRDYIRLVRYFSIVNGNYTVSVLEEVGLNNTASILRDLIARADTAFNSNDTVLALGYYREVLSLSTDMIFSKLILSQYNTA